MLTRRETEGQRDRDRETETEISVALPPKPPFSPLWGGATPNRGDILLAPGPLDMDMGS